MTEQKILEIIKNKATVYMGGFTAVEESDFETLAEEIYIEFLNTY